MYLYELCVNKKTYFSPLKFKDVLNVSKNISFIIRPFKYKQNNFHHVNFPLARNISIYLHTKTLAFP